MRGCDCEHSKEWHGRDGCGFPGCDCSRVPATRRALDPGQPPRTPHRAPPRPSPAARRAEADRERAERLRRGRQ